MRFATLFIVITAITQVSCNSTKALMVNQAEAYKVINQVFTNRETKELLKESLTELSTSPKVFENYLNPDNLKYTAFRNSDGSKIDFDSILSESEWNELFGKATNPQEVEFSEQELDIDIKIVKRFTNEALLVSVPIFSSDMNYSFVFVESISGGSLRTYQRVNGDWKLFSMTIIWTAD